MSWNVAIASNQIKRMNLWRIEPADEKNVVEWITYMKDGISFIYEKHYYRGEIFVWSAEMPVYSGDETVFGSNGEECVLYDEYYACVARFVDRVRKGIREDIEEFYKNA